MNVVTPMNVNNNTASFTIREATPADLPALVRLHVEAFNETHAPVVGNGPSYAVREPQWQDAFRRGREGRWFCYVVEKDDGELVGFATGTPYTEKEPQPPYSGRLKQIYVLRQYHRRGLGRRLVGHVARRFLEEGIGSALLFGEAGNPSNGFYERLGAGRLLGPGGEFDGGFGWRDLRTLAAIAPID